MAEKISQLDDLGTLTGNEYVPVVKDGNNNKLSLSRLITLTTKNTVGLGNVDNTSDLQKPVSQQTQLALDAKANEASLTSLQQIVGQKADSSIVNQLQQTVAGKANESELVNKANVQHSHTVDEVQGLGLMLQGLNNLINQKENIGDPEPQSEITGLTEALSAKVNAADLPALVTDIVNQIVIPDIDPAITVSLTNADW